MHDLLYQLDQNPVCGCMPDTVMWLVRHFPPGRSNLLDIVYMKHARNCFA
jgi:hypothetical protein